MGCCSGRGQMPSVETAAETAQSRDDGRPPLRRFPNQSAKADFARFLPRFQSSASDAMTHGLPIEEHPMNIIKRTLSLLLLGLLALPGAARAAWGAAPEPVIWTARLEPANARA